MVTTQAILVDITKCIGCKSCEQACKQTHGFPMDAEARLSPTALTVVEGTRGSLRSAYVHALPGSSLRVGLPRGCFKEDRSRPGYYDGSKCIGCRYCLVACPFSVPRYEWTKLVPYVKKCDMCASRQANGKPPACVEACPVQASISGSRDEVLEIAMRRILADTKYVKHIYGSDEVGGTSVFFISDVPFEKLGFAAPPKQAMPVLTANALGDGPTVILVGGALLSGLYWITQRRALVALAEAREQSTKERG